MCIYYHKTNWDQSLNEKQNISIRKSNTKIVERCSNHVDLSVLWINLLYLWHYVQRNSSDGIVFDMHAEEN